MIDPTLRRLALVLLLAPARAAYAQAERTPEAKPTPTISDNSFLVEEAYNQEEGVVQHISNFRRAPDGSWLFTFTQEWPAPSQRHQLSYTVPLLSVRGVGTGIGDLILNYRYQAIGKDEDRVWFSPRLSAILPTGDVGTGRGNGGLGAQVMLPVSITFGEQLATHWNLGATAIRARSVNGLRQNTRGLNAAASAIWLLAPTLNLMLESAWEYSEPLDDAGVPGAERRFVIVPGVRAAINFASGMQIVPGVGVPIGFGPSRGERDLFLYFSVEHSFK
jgi:hypothetical protein